MPAARPRPCTSFAVVALAIAILLPSLPAPASAHGESAQGKPTLTPDDYGQWESLAGLPALSPDGGWVAYRVDRVDGDSELRLRALAGEETRVLPWGTNATFSADSAWIAWTVRPSTEERERSEGGPSPRNGAAVLRLAGGDERNFEAVRSLAFDATGRFLALLGYAPDEPEGKGADLRVLDLAADTQLTLGNVGEMAWNDTGSLLALTIATGTDLGNGVQVHDFASGRLRGLDGSPSAYRGLAWREDAADLAVLRSAGVASDDGAAHEVLAWRALDGDAPARIELAGDDIAAGFEIVRHATPRWSDDGAAIAIGLRPVEEDAEAEGVATEDASEAPAGEEVAETDDTKRPEGDREEEPDLPGLQIWHSADRRIFPQQRVAAPRDERRTLLAVWRLDEDRVVQVGTDLMAGAQLLEGWRHGLERVAEPYGWGEMFGRPYHDVWAVEIAGGERRRVAERVRRSWGSAAGRYLLTFDGEDYWTHDLLDAGAPINVTASVDAVFANTEYDTPTDQLPPHGVGGWLADDAAVLLYDRFDVWRVEPDGASAVRLTRGAEHELIHRVHDLDREEPAFDPAAPLYFSLRGEATEQRGYARLDPGAVTAEVLLLEDRFVTGLTKADEADLYLYRAEARHDSPDYFAAGADLASPRQLSATNPFQDDYAWTRAELIDFESETGRPLQAALLYPAGHEPGRRYPMIVYTYEILAPQIHRYEAPSERDYYNFTAWTQAGYFVLMPDIVYRAREPGISAIEAVRPAVGAVVEAGLVDADRVGLIGHSWGGYQATFLPTRIDTFAASVAGAPLTDFVSFMGQLHWNQGAPELTHWETGQARMEVPFWEDPEAHRRASPIHEVHNMETPLLMAFGNEDGVVDWDQGTEFYNFARRAGKQMVLLVYEGEDHGFRNEANQIDYHRRILEWFGHYLKGEPAAEWITQGVPVDRLDEEKRRVATGRR